MLKLNNVTKTYITGALTQTALDNVSISFRENEFVSILGPSGSGKTTMLNIIGGLDRYTDGDLIINGKSTKMYKDVDWDIYRNNSIGFVFQSYNLIPHQTILSNVELAMTLAGVSRSERRKRAAAMLEKVGLGDQLHKKPNQMSGGQMQRVAIARALVNNPDILLADEPTGALDSETSVQIMELLKEIAKEKLVIMVTHNPELAEQYSTRIVRLLDGKIIDDSNPFNTEEPLPQQEKEKKRKKISMSFFTALSLSFNNLKTKKGRTILTAFAGSIGIIGIALILSISNGVQVYIKNLEKDTLSSYPIEIQSQTINLEGMMGDAEDMSISSDETEHDLDKVYQRGNITDYYKRTTLQTMHNDLAAFKNYLESDEGKELVDNTNAIQYAYDLNIPIYMNNEDGESIMINPSDVFNTEMTEAYSSTEYASMFSGMSSVWSEIIGNEELVYSQYDVIAGEWCDDYNEVVLVVDENNEISDLSLYSLGLKDSSKLEEIKDKFKNGEEITDNDEPSSYSYNDILGLEYKLVPSIDLYEKNDDNTWTNKSEDSVFLKNAVENGIDIKVVGIVRPAENALSSSISGVVGYTSKLTDYVIDYVNNSEIVKQQMDNPETDVFTGNEFVKSMEITPEIIAQLTAQLTDEEKAMISSLSEEQIAKYAEEQLGVSSSTYEDNLTALGYVDTSNPSAISLYPASFEAKDKISKLIDEYNEKQLNDGKEENQIKYNDLIGIMIAAETDIVNTISYVLVAFVSISLIVSSIMIGIITYISVLERTKEIGVLRSIGASKRDISRVFNAETVIIGLIAGALGIGITVLLNIPINIIIKEITDVSGIANLPVEAGIILIGISVLLTLIAGLVPSRLAAKKDPVVALRSE